MIGTPLTLAAARRLAAEVARQRARGRDVVADIAVEKQQRRVSVGNTFAAAVRDFIEEHARPQTRRWEETARLLGLRPDSLDPIRGGLAERWRDKPLTDITSHDIYTVIDEARRRGVPGLSRRNDGISDARGRSMARTLSKLFGWLLAHRRITVNPTLGVYCPPAPRPRYRVLTNDEIKLLWAACAQVGEPFGQLLQIMLLTGARREEVAQIL